MRALLKTGEWVEINTKHLFNNQYNTTDGKRIFDGQILKIEDDARVGKGVCRYCGKIVVKGEEEQHFWERENNSSCDKCFWYRDNLIDRHEDKEDNTITNDDGTITVQTVRKVVKTYVKKCKYHNDHHTNVNCTNKECRAYGITWFTPDNTFFMQFPDGFYGVDDVNVLKRRGFKLNGYNWKYEKKIGSYQLYAHVSNDKVEYYTMWNARRRCHFFFVGETLYTFDHRFGCKKVKTLDGVLDKYMEKVKEILEVI